MSRFEETIQRDLRQIADRATPSPDAWSQIQSRIADQEPAQETEIIMLTDNTTRPRTIVTTNRRWPLVAAAAVVALVVGGLALISRDDGDEQPADDPPPAPTLAPAPDPVEEPGILALPPAGATLAPGRYASDALGVPIEFDLDVGQTAAWSLLNEEPGRLWIISSGSDSEFIGIGRLGSWYDATEARTEDTTGLGSIPPDDIDGYIEQNGIIVVRSSDTQVGGRSAKYRRFRVDPTPGATADFCGSGAPCLWAGTGSADVVGGTVNPLIIGGDRVQSFWLVDMDEFEPVYIIAAAQLGEVGDEQWFTDVVEPIIDSMTFGEPVPAVEGGTARVPERLTLSGTMDGVRTEGAQGADGTFPIASTSVLEGGITGELVSSGTRTGNDVAEQGVFTGTIAGVGSGTLNLETTTVIGAFGSVTVTSVIVGGTDDFEAVTGSGAIQITNDVEASGAFTARYEFELVLPAAPIG